MGSIVHLSGFGDEISPDLATQLDVLAAAGIRHLELRAAWGKGVLDLTDAEAERAADELSARGFRVSALATPIGKIRITDPFPPHLEKFRRALDLARLFRTSYLRLFSFFIPEGNDPARHAAEVLDRMQALVEAARGSGVTLLHENEKHIYGDTPARCLEILEAFAGRGLRAIFDPANFVQCSVRPMTDAYPRLAPYVEYVHVKDALSAGGEVTPAGRGDGEVRPFLAALRAKGYAGFLSLEPHLAAAGPYAGFSGPDLFRTAADALKEILADLDWTWR